ncbi:MAG: AAA family ATPase [Gammaproteobacteria bacterium]|nr:AAA family ATPase [Gammaproteobacteria bacterium]
MDATIKTPRFILALLEPEAYSHPVWECKLIQTHISWIILTGRYAYKIKKPVNLGFLDFSSLEKRRYFCEEELRLNRRLAPSYYLSVVPITGREDHPIMNGDGPTLEYAVRMRQFQHRNQFDEMLSRGELQESHIDALATMIASFHKNIPSCSVEEPYGDTNHITHIVTETIKSFRQALSEPEMLRQLDQIDTWCKHQFQTLGPSFEKRKIAGFVRECHGDMHLRNIAWDDGTPLVFDCIEFSPGLRWNDVISEIAFLIMDLDDRQQSQLSSRFMNTYLEYTGDYAGLSLLRFYLTYRALVRGMVAAIRLIQTDSTQQEHIKVDREAHEYLDLATAYTKTRTPMLILTRGPSGTGKTTYSQNLLQHLGAIRIRSDVERKRLHGQDAHKITRTTPGEGIYGASSTDKTYAHLLKLTQEILDAGYHVIVDATFQSPVHIRAFQKTAIENNIGFIIVEFYASTHTLRQRVSKRTGDASDADIAVLDHQLQSWQTLSEQDYPLFFRVNTESREEATLALNTVIQTVKSIQTNDT